MKIIALLKRVRFLRVLANWATQLGLRWELIKWECGGRPVPPPHMVKQRLLRHLARKFRLKIFVETGTYYGDMIEALKIDFEQIHSIELSEELCGKAKARFAHDLHVRTIHGDSARVLRSVLAELQQPALFWLDGHYSSGPTAKGEKDTPVLDELAQLFATDESRHVIVIDDARCFGTCAAYPRMDELVAFVREKRPDAEVIAESDCLIVAPVR